MLEIDAISKKLTCFKYTVFYQKRFFGPFLNFQNFNFVYQHQINLLKKCSNVCLKVTPTDMSNIPTYLYYTIKVFLCFINNQYECFVFFKANFYQLICFDSFLKIVYVLLRPFLKFLNDKSNFERAYFDDFKENLNPNIMITLHIVFRISYNSY